MQPRDETGVRSAVLAFALALLTSPAAAAPLPVPLDEMSRSDLLGVVFEGPEAAGDVLDALTARVERLDPAARHDLQAAVAWLADNCPYNRAVHASVALLGAALRGPELQPFDVDEAALGAAAAAHQGAIAGHVARLATLHFKHARLLATLGRPPAADPARGHPRAVAAQTERLGGLKDVVAALDPDTVDDIGAATASVTPHLAGQWPLKIFLFVYHDALQAAAGDARRLAELTDGPARDRAVAFATRAEALGRMIERLTSQYC